MTAFLPGDLRIWPCTADGTETIAAGRLGRLLEGVDRRMPGRTWWPADNKALPLPADVFPPGS